MADIRTELKANDADSDQVKADKEGATSQRAARNKTKNFVGNAELEAVERLLGGTAEGQRLLALLRESNELTRLHNKGMVRYLAYSDSSTHFTTPKAPRSHSRPHPCRYHRRSRCNWWPLTDPTRCSVSRGRALDKATGRRSNVERYVRQNRGEGGIQQAMHQASSKDVPLKKPTEEQNAQRVAACDPASRSNVAPTEPQLTTRQTGRGNWPRPTGHPRSSRKCSCQSVTRTPSSDGSQRERAISDRSRRHHHSCSWSPRP